MSLVASEHRWRGEIDVPLTAKGLGKAYALGVNIEGAGGLSLVLHDWLSRCRDTARAICANTVQISGPRPWKMGPNFEGRPITPESIRWAQWYAANSTEIPDGGEPFCEWYRHWIDFMEVVDRGNYENGQKLGIVTHNRNLQALYASIHGHFDIETYNRVGPDFLTVHRYAKGYIEPWDREKLVPGVYLVRHAETSFGT